MDFIVRLLRTSGNKSIWVLLDRLTKSAHFLLLEKLTRLFVSELVPKLIISDWDKCFTSHFWKGLQDAMDTKLKFNSAYYTQTNG